MTKLQESLSKDRGNVALRLDTLVRIRWLAIAGQTVAVFFVHWGLGFELLLLPCLLVIAASAWLNLFLRFRYPGNVRWQGPAVTALLGYDILQLGMLLYLTGGIQNPFAILLSVPVVISSATQRAKDAMRLFVLALGVISLLMFFHQTLPWYEAVDFVLPLELRGGIWVAIASTMAFTAIYTFRVADESRKLANALAATEIVLQREQHVSNLDGLAAAAAHELGTPLATIALVSKEMSREITTDNPLHEDVMLLRSQADRCREILRKISSLSSQEDENILRLSVEVLMEELMAPYRDLGIELIAVRDGNEPIPTTARNAAILYGLGNLLENAVDFASEKVVFKAEWTGSTIVFSIEDDGPGFPPGLLEKIGDPFISQRNDKTDSTGGGLGLGLFIAKTLLERNGAALSFSNLQSKSELAAGTVGKSGAFVTVTWQQEDFEKRTRE